MMLAINFADGVRCLHCKDNITPDHDPDDCPLVVLVAANVVAVAAASGAQLVPWLLRAMGSCLDHIAESSRRTYRGDSADL